MVVFKLLGFCNSPEGIGLRSFPTSSGRRRRNGRRRGKGGERGRRRCDEVRLAAWPAGAEGGWRRPAESRVHWDGFGGYGWLRVFGVGATVVQFPGGLRVSRGRLGNIAGPFWDYLRKLGGPCGDSGVVKPLVPDGMAAMRDSVGMLDSRG